MNQKDIKIVKLFIKGMSKPDIARRIGYGGDIQAGIARINKTINKTKLCQTTKNN